MDDLQSLIELKYIVGILSSVLIGWALRMRWKVWMNWENRLIAQDERLKEYDKRFDDQGKAIAAHDVTLAEVTTTLKHVKEVTDATGQDVKKLLIQNGDRASA